MNNSFSFSKGSLFFAPMEGITDEPYRMAMFKSYPEWDRFFTDFLRIPSSGSFSRNYLKKHFGLRAYDLPSHRKKTGYQILTSLNASIVETVNQIKDLGFDHLDINLGCPSKRVNGHKGGAYLLSDLVALKKIIRLVRKEYPYLFTAKIRVGYQDDLLYTDILKLLEDEGVQAVTVHARTRDQLYRGVADWSYIKKAVETLNIPVVGNGDIWEAKDIADMFEKTGCHSVMVARGAMKTPWLASIYKENKDNLKALNEEFLLQERKANIPLYFYTLEKEYLNFGLKKEFILKRFKALSRYLFLDFQDSEEIRNRFFRSDTLDQFVSNLEEL